MANLLAVLLPVILFSAVPESKAHISPADTILLHELQEAQLKIAYLESVLQKSIEELDSKTHYITDKEKKIEELSHEIDRLEDVLSSIQDEPSRANERVNVLEEEVRLLWATSRKKNFEIHSLEFQAEDAEMRLDTVKTQVEDLAAIVSEQWIQIQQLETALQQAKVRVLKVKRQVSFTSCPFLKFMKDLICHQFDTLKETLDHILFNKDSALSSFIAPVLHQLERTYSGAKHYHHQLQGFIKQAMDQNEFTAVLANKEVVFFVASALITFPVVTTFVFLSSQFG